jgi:ketosteroid isomerase-like protein
MAPDRDGGGCTEETTMSGQTIPESIEQHFQAALAGDETAFSAFLDDTFVQDWPQSGERVRGKQACLNIVRNYPGGPPRMELARISGEGDHWVVEGRGSYPDGSDYHLVAILEFRDGKVVHEIDYFGPAYPAPAWRKEWVEAITD